MTTSTRLVLVIALLFVALLLRGSEAQARPRSQSLQSDSDDDDSDVTLGGAQHTNPPTASPSKSSADDADLTLGADAPASPPKPRSRRAADSDDDEDETPLDPDEFEGGNSHVPTPSRPASSSPARSSPAPSSPVEPEPESDDLFGVKYLLETTAISLISVYAIIFFIGRSTNDGIAKAWFGTFRPVFEAQFAALGAYGSSTGVQAGPALLKDSESVYKFYASGRRFCLGALCTLELIKRHDLLSYVLALFDLAPTRDSLTIEVPMSPEDMEPFVFAVMPRKHEKRLRKASRDLEQFTVAVPSRKLPASLSVLTDCPELEDELVDELIARTLSQNEDLFASLHLSDQHEGPTIKVFPNCKQKMLKFTFNLPTNRDMSRLLKLTEMALYFVDRIATLKLSPAAAARSAKKRKEIADAEYRASHDQRQEAAQRRKEEQKRKDEEALAKLTPEQLKKREAKEQKLAQKKKTPKVKIMR